MNHSTPRPKGRGLLQVHPERRLSPRLERRGLAPSNGSRGNLSLLGHYGFSNHPDDLAELEGLGNQKSRPHSSKEFLLNSIPHPVIIPTGVWGFISLILRKRPSLKVPAYPGLSEQDRTPFPERVVSLLLRFLRPSPDGWLGQDAGEDVSDRLFVIHQKDSDASFPLDQGGTTGSPFQGSRLAR